MRAAPLAFLMAGLLLPGGALAATASAGLATPSPTPDGGNSTLLSRAELLGGSDTDVAADLYYVAENGTWYHARPNGSVGEPAPAGATIPNIANETAEVPAADRPVYVWKVTDGSCGSTLYDASTGDVIAPYPIPGCPPQTPPTASATVTAISAETTDEPALTVEGPGFGVLVAVVAVLGTGLGLARR